MRGWITLGLGAGLLYYVATETNKLDEPIAKSNEILQKIERKLDSITGTRVIKVDNHIAHLKKEIGERMSKRELQALDDILVSEYTLQEFKDDYCGGKTKQHDYFNKENLFFICDKLK